MKKMYTNNTNTIVYPGGLAIRPGDSRLVDECYFPKTDADSQLAFFDASEFVKQSVNDAIKLLKELSEESLVDVLELEEAKAKPRVSLVAAIADELEERNANFAKEVVLAELSEKETEELQSMLLDEENSDEFKSLIQSTLDERLSAENNGSQEEQNESNQDD